MTRSRVLVAAAVAALSFTALPAQAGPAETAYLQSLANTWTGRGELSGAESGTVSCRLTFKPSGKRVNYTGRCNMPDAGSQPFSGSISYNDSRQRYEAKSSGSTAVGQKSGDSLTFAHRNRTARGTSNSTMSVSPNSLVVDFVLSDRQGDQTSSRIVFARS